MEGEHRCIICSTPVGPEGFIGSVKNMGVRLCEKHAEECKKGCENCAYSGKCPMYIKNLKN